MVQVLNEFNVALDLTGSQDPLVPVVRVSQVVGFEQVEPRSEQHHLRHIIGQFRFWHKETTQPFQL